MAIAAVLPPRAPLELKTPASYISIPFDLPADEIRFVGLLACQRDPLLRTLEARVTRCEKSKTVAGKRKDKKPAADEYEVELSDTVIFPTGGGQPHDVGTIVPLTRPNEPASRVRECVRVGLAAVHLVDAPLAVGERVRVEIDWDRRLDLMTQHLGQHLLSAVLEQECGLETVGWSLQDCPEPSYVELKRAPSAAEIARIEALCNAHIRSDLPVHVDVALPAADGSSRPSKLPKDYVGGVERVVSIGDLDSNPCCGSHPPRLGLLQALKVLPHTTSIRGTNVRLYFLVGGRVLAQYADAERAVRAACASLSCGAPDLPARVAGIADEAKALRSRERRLRSRLAVVDAREILASQRRVVVRDDADDDAEYLGLIANALLDAGLDHAVALALQPPVGSSVTDAALVVIGGDGIDALGAKLRQSFGSRLKGGGRGRFQGKLAGRWTDDDLAALEGALASSRCTPDLRCI